MEVLQIIFLLLFHPKNSFAMKKSFLSYLFLQYPKIINFDLVTKEINVEQNPKFQYIPDYPYRILVNRSYRSGKINTLFMFTANENINLYAKDLNEPKCQLLIKKNDGNKTFKWFKGI